MRRRSLALAAALTVAALTVAACSGGTYDAPPTTASTTATPAASRSPDPNFDSGQKVFITTTGFRPKWLVSIWKTPVVWVNQTNKTQTVIFDHQLVRSGPIPPGGMFSWTAPNVESVTYHSGTMAGAHGAIQVSEPAT